MSLVTFNTKRVIAVVTASLMGFAVMAADATPKAEESTSSPFSSVLFIAMCAISILLMLGIVGMAELVKAGASQEKFRRKKKKTDADSIKAIALLMMLSFGGTLFAQDATAAIAAPPEIPFDYWGMGSGVFVSMLLLIIVEAIIFYVLYRTGITLLRNEKTAKAIAEKGNWFMRSSVMKSMTEANTPQEEEALMLDHDYDGIRELDNNLPAWWKYGFYLTIVVAVVYLLHYHVFNTGPSSKEEYVNELTAADEQIAEYRKTTANLVDENTVVRLTDPASISAGHAVFRANCTPCHGEFAEGKEGLGPNLTDDYWKHKGGTADIFKSIKYGWTDRGMKSWEQDLKPLEIQQVVSWVQSIHGSNPANAKAPEGDLYVDSVTAGAVPVIDSMKSDSVKTKSAIDSTKK
jgi:cytochrome c oxidase cbb3-type subunit 3